MAIAELRSQLTALESESCAVVTNATISSIISGVGHASSVSTPKLSTEASSEVEVAVEGGVEAKAVEEEE